MKTGGQDVMGRSLPFAVSVGLHVGMFTALAIIPARSLTSSSPDLITIAVAPQAQAEPPPPPAAPPPVVAHAPSPQPIEKKMIRSPKRSSAAGARPEEVKPDTTAAPLPVESPSEVELPSDDGTGAGGDQLAGDGDAPGGGSGDGHGHGDGGRPPVPLDVARHTRLPYTREAIEADIHGTVLVELLIDAQGNVADAKLKKRIGYGLDAIAATTARRFRFQPALDGAGRPVAQWIEWEFRFEPPR